MAKKKADEPERKPTQTNLRIIDPMTLVLVDECAKAERRSRNLMLNILVEEALKARGLWKEKSVEP